MKRFNVEYNDKIACFSPVVDKFVTKFMEKSEFELWCYNQYDKWDYLFQRNIEHLSLEESVFKIKSRYGKEYTLLHLRDIGISFEDAIDLIRGEKNSDIYN